jgi:hypothetical protein
MMRRPAKVNASGKIRGHYDFTPRTYRLLRQIAEADHRSQVDELSFLIEERASTLNISGEFGEEVGQV